MHRQICEVRDKRVCVCACMLACVSVFVRARVLAVDKYLSVCVVVCWVSVQSLDLYSCHKLYLAWVSN